MHALRIAIAALIMSVTAHAGVVTESLILGTNSVRTNWPESSPAFTGGTVTGATTFAQAITVTNGAAGATTNAPTTIDAATPYTPGLRVKMRKYVNTNVWTPANIASNVAGWWSASDLAGNGTTVNGWTNKYGTWRFSSSAGPVLATNGINGRNALLFAGTGSLTGEASVAISQPYWVFMAFQSTNSDNSQGVIENASATLAGFYAQNNGAGSVPNSFLNYAGAALTCSGNGATDAHVAHICGNGASSVIALSYLSNVGNAGTAALGQPLIGSQSGPSSPFMGYLAELVIVTNAMSQDDIDRTRSYLAYGYISNPTNELTTNASYRGSAPLQADVDETADAIEIVDSVNTIVAGYDPATGWYGTGTNLATGAIKADGSVSMVGTFTQRNSVISSICTNTWTSNTVFQLLAGDTTNNMGLFVQSGSTNTSEPEPLIGLIRSTTERDIVIGGRGAGLSPFSNVRIIGSVNRSITFENNSTVNGGTASKLTQATVDGNGLGVRTTAIAGYPFVVRGNALVETNLVVSNTLTVAAIALGTNAAQTN
jgi:hypothetical protein